MDSFELRFCLCSLFRISLDSVRVCESVGLDSVNALDSVFPRISVLDFKFLGVAFSRILLCFLESCVLCEKGEGLECAGMGEWRCHAREVAPDLGGRARTL